MAGGGEAREAVGIEQGEAGDGVRLGGVGAGDVLQAAEQGGEKGEEQGREGVQPRARGGAIRLRGSAQDGEGFGRSVRMN